MTYRPLSPDFAKWPHVERFVRGPLEQVHFAQARTLLRLPQSEAGLPNGCETALGGLLLASLGAIADALYRSSGGDHREAFRTLLVREYPWDTEEISPAGAMQSVSALIGEYRGDSISPLGAWATLGDDGPPAGSSPGRRLHFRRLETTDNDGLAEHMLETLEVARDWPLDAMPRTIDADEAASYVNLERFYWGIRETVNRLAAKPAVMMAAERYLSR
jgi:hypothetical protein